MAKNDLIVVDAILDQLSSELRNRDRGEVFERFVLDQVLKNYDLTEEQIEFGWTDGALDGGIDGFFTLVNGHLISDPRTHVWPRSSAEIDLFLLSCKHHDTFQQATLDALIATVQELFELETSASRLKGKYSDEVLQARDCFAAAYKRLAITNPKVRVRMIYASRGDTEKTGATVAARAQQLVGMFDELFSGVEASFEFIGAAELVEMQRKVRAFTLSLPFLEHLATEDGYIVLAQLVDYARFVTDDNGELRRYLFDSNVRDFLGSNSVNADIEATLRDSASPSFWWLNNGVTILATSAVTTGKLMHVRDIQIVNGLQTTETLYGHFVRSSRKENSEKPILIKVIVSNDELVRDKIIRATNSQSAVELSALHATDSVQRDIESVLESHDWFYERRTNYYKNAGRPPTRIIRPNFLAAGSIALLLRNPERAAAFKARQIRDQTNYDAVFSAHYPLDAWPTVVAFMKASEEALVQHRQRTPISWSSILRRWRCGLAFVATAVRVRSFEFGHHDLARLDFDEEARRVVAECCELIIPIVQRWPRMGHQAFIAACNAVSQQFGVPGDFNVGRREFLQPLALPRRQELEITEAQVDQVKQVLPKQPWDRGVHAKVAEQLGVPNRVVHLAIQILIRRGIFNVQRDGIVYGTDGQEIVRDERRARPQRT